MLDNKEILVKSVALRHINSLFLIRGKIFGSRECKIRIPRIKLPLEGSIPDDEKNFFRKISRSVGYLIDTSSELSTNDVKNCH